MSRLSQSVVLSLLKEEDLEGLQAAGAPADEYETEAAMIAQLVEEVPRGDMNLDRVTKIVADVWWQMFGPFDEDALGRRWPGYQRVARRMVQAQAHGKTEGL
jgi:hypothetical protein